MHAPAHAISSDFEDLENHRILIVDDNEAIHCDFQKILSSGQEEAEFDAESAALFGQQASTRTRPVFDLSFASQGEQALALVKAALAEGRRYSVVFTDVRMPPGWDGLETALRLWEADPDLQIVICTAYSDKSWEEMMDKLGHPERVLILKKPFDAIEVLQLANALTEKWALLQSSKRSLECLERTVQLRTVELEMAHHELKKNEVRFRALSEQAPIGIFETAVGGEAVYVNPEWERITGIPFAQAVGAGWQNSLHEEDKAAGMAKWKEAVEHGREFEGELRFLNATGETRWMRVRAVPIQSECGHVTGHVGTLQDVTAQRNLVEELARARDTAIESAQLKARFLANMSHEIRTPMNGIIGMTDLALDTDLTREQREYLNMVKASAQSLLGLINDILDFSKIEAGKLHLDVSPFSLRECITGILKPLGLRADQKSLELIADIPADVPDHVLGDSLRLRQILMNLTDNAIKFTHEGDVMLRVRAENAGTTDQVFHFSVTDTGIGIPPEKQAVIFEAFSQADGTTTRNYGGTGLGLAIASELVRKMDGRIWVESTVGQGTTFHFTIRMEVRPASLPTPARAKMRTLIGMRALIVDDNPVHCRILQETVSGWGIEAAVAQSGEAALEAMVEAARVAKPYPLVLLDALMPGMDGFSLAERMHGHPELAGATVMMLSSAMPPGSHERCRSLGVTSCLTKPVSQAELLDAILVAVSGRTPAVDYTPGPLLVRSSGSLRILLAEDNQVNRTLATSILHKRGHTVIHAVNGRQAVTAAATGEFDLILMDVQMPEMDGLDATAAIRQMEASLGRRTPIVAMTAHAMSGDRERCIEAGMDDYISKPIDKEQVLKVIARIVEQRTDQNISAPIRTNPPSPTLSNSTGPAISSREQLLNQLDDDEQLLARMIALFQENTPAMLQDIRASIARRAPKDIARAAHAIQSSLGAFGAHEARRLSTSLEHEAHKENYEYIEHTFIALEHATAQVHAALAALAPA